MRLVLNTVENSRKTLSRLIRLYCDGKMESVEYRNIIYGLDKLLAYWKLEKELDIEKRLDEIEAKIGGLR